MSIDGVKVIPLNIGTPQGSRISPGLFIIIFDKTATYILKKNQGHIKLLAYADDTKIFTFR